MKTKLLFTLLMAIHLGVAAQTDRNCFDYDFSPDVKAMLKASRPQMNLNTGTLNLTVPIYTWHDQDFKLPFNLSYATNGFRPANQTGIVGLDWTLVIGGRITRRMNGIDDLKSKGRFFYNGTFPNESTYNLTAPANYDAEYKSEMIPNGSSYFETDPDLFHFDFLGNTGSFILNSSGEFVVFDSNGERGTYTINYNSTSGSFIIKTANGYEYHFGSNNKSREVLYNTNSIHATYKNQSRRVLNDSEITVIAWCLDKIIAPNNRELHFSYSAYNGSKYNIPQNFEYTCTTFAQGLNELRYINFDTIESFYAHKHSSTIGVAYLDSISIIENSSSEPQTIAIFGYSDKEFREVDETDNNIYSQLVTPQKKLDSLQIMTNAGECVGGANFNYSYKNKRLILHSVYVKNSGLYQMEYNLDGSLPGILTNGIDFWGYYNGRTDLDDFNFIPTSLDATFHEHINSDIKNPNAEYSILGTLKSICYPTGGRTEFEYEPNTANKILLRQPTSPTSSELDSLGLGPFTYLDPFIPTLRFYRYYTGYDICGGVRIKSITDYNETQMVYRKKYSYNKPGTNESSGIILNFNKYHAKDMGNITLCNPFITFPDNTLDKSYMAYSTVAEEHPDGTKIVYQFSDYIDFPDEYSPYSKLLPYSTPEYEMYEGRYMNNVMREPDSRHYRRGKVKSIEKYDGSGRLLHKEEYEYIDSDSSYVSYLTMSGKYIWSARRFTCDRLTQKITETIYDQGQISSVRRYDYNSLGQLRSESYTDSQESNGHKQYFRYCHENENSSSMSSLKGAVSDIIKTHISNNLEFIVSSEKFTYAQNNENIKPISNGKYDIEAPIAITPGTSINSLCNIGRNGQEYTYTYEYNSKFRLTKETAPGGRYVLYEWDPDNKYIVSKIENSPLQKYEYEWKDMIGLTKMKHPTNQEETYEYDENGRLRTIKDSFGNPVVSYEYNIKNM